MARKRLDSEWSSVTLKLFFEVWVRKHVRCFININRKYYQYFINWSEWSSVTLKLFFQVWVWKNVWWERKVWSSEEVQWIIKSLGLWLIIEVFAKKKLEILVQRRPRFVKQIKLMSEQRDRSLLWYNVMKHKQKKSIWEKNLKLF